MQTADDILRYEQGPRLHPGLHGYLIATIAGGWSLFQLAIAKWVLVDSITVRCIHLAFALVLVYLCFPFVKRSGSIRWLRARFGERALPLYDKSRVPWLDYALAGGAIAAALYLALDYQGIGERAGVPLARDIVAGVVLLLLLLEAARRAVGFALPCVASVFIVYSFFSQSMPGLLAFKNASLSKVVNKLTLSTEGIYGVPLDVSASVVFLFVLFGAMLERAGGGQWFIDVSFSLLGRFRGGPAKAAVLASGLTGMVNGSSIANTVTTGTFTIPLMKRTGFPAVKAGAIEVAASTNGQLMPPIMGAAAFIIAEYCQVTYLEVVRAAFVPAIISYLALLYITHLESAKLNLQPIAKKDLPQFHQVFWRGLHFLIPLGFLLYQLVIQRRTAQLAAHDAILALAALMLLRHVVLVVNGKQTLRDGCVKAGQELLESLVAGGRNMMTIGVAVAAAGIIVGIVTLGLGTVITEIIGVLSGGHLVPLLLLTAVASLILGMGLPTTANYIVMASLTAPAIFALSLEAGLAMPLIAAHLFCFYFGILSDDTPPVGLSAYAAAAISKADPIQTGIQGFVYDIRTAILPFMFVFNTDLLLINVTHPLQIGMVLVTGTLAMFAFASLTQNYLRTRNCWYESLLLLAVVLLLLRPDLPELWWSVPKPVTYVIGVGVFMAVAGLQSLRLQPAAREPDC